MTLLVSGAGAGDQSLYGTATVANVAQGAFAAGWESLSFGPVRVSFDILGRDVAFDFTVEYAQLANSVRLDFDANRPVTGAGGNSFAAFGAAGVVNAAQGAFEIGWGDSAFSTPRISFDYLGRNVSFDLISEFRQSALNVGLYFDGKPLVNVPTLGLFEAFGTPNAKGVLYVTPAAFDEYGTFGDRLIIINGERVIFDFTVDLAVPDASNLRLDYDSSRPIPAYGFDAGAFGTPSLVNVAEGAFEDGWDSLIFGETTRASPPSRANNLQFEFVDDYTPDTGANIAFAFGDPSTKEVRPSGWDSLLTGNSNIYFDGNIKPLGIDAALWGNANIANWLREIYPLPWEQTVFGTPDVDFYQLPVTQWLRAEGSIDSRFGDDGFISGGLRYLDTTFGSLIALEFGTAFVAYSERTIEVAFSFFLSFGIPAIDRTHFVTTAGVEMLSWGTTYVHDSTQTVYAGGEKFVEFGAAELTRSPRALFAVGFPSLAEGSGARWGSPNVWNLRKIVQQLDAPSTDDGGVFGSYMHTFVLNRNRTIFTYGHRDDKFLPTHLIDLTGRPILVSGFDALNQNRSWLERSLIAYSIRHVYPEPIEPFPIARWTVLTKTPELFPVGIESGEKFGTAGIVNTRRYFQWIGNIYATEFGTAFIAPAVRSVEQYWPAEPRYGMPTIWNYSRYLNFPGLEPAGFGRHDVIEHHTTFAPKWPTRPDAFGEETRIRNLTPELHVYWFEATEWGRANVFLQWRRFQFEGWQSSYVSRGAVIKDRTITIPVRTLNVLAFGPRTTIRNLIPDAPVAQTVQGSGAIDDRIGSATVRGNVLYVQGTAMAAFGVGRVHANSLYPPSIQEFGNDGQFGNARLNATQWVDLDRDKGIKPGDFYEWNAARVDPFTIWCWLTPPAQAAHNNPGGPFKLIDDAGSVGEHDPAARPFFGSATITNKNRQIYAQGPDWLQMSQQTWISNSLRYLLPRGTKFTRYGYPSTNGEQYVDEEMYATELLRMGEPSVGFPDGPYTRSIMPQGLEGGFGTTQIDLFNRELALSAWDSALYGTARIHPPEPIIPPGLDATLFGATMIDFRIRTLTPEGWEGFIARETIGYFRDRMKVTRGV
jgi:hypothetical protein